MPAPTVSEDLFSAQALADPYPVFDRLRAAGPVHLLPGLGIYLVVRHEQVRQALDDPQTFSSNIVAQITTGGDGEAGVLAAENEAAVDVLATVDPPAHTAQRRCLKPVFTRARVEALADFIDATLRPRVGELVARGGGDWMAGVAVHLPVRVTGHLLGLPAVDADRLAAWSDAAVELLSGTASPERMAALGADMGRFIGYLHERVTAARAHPAGGVIDVLNGTVDAGEISHDEAVMIALQLVIAGSESTASLIGSAVRTLATDRALQARLRADHQLIEPFVEEVLRLESPFRGHFRVSTRDTELGGVPIPRGSRVMLVWGAANRDPAAFPEPAALDLHRPAIKTHTAFGRGLHFCLGAHLARLEAVQAIRQLLAATSSVTVADEPPEYLRSLFVRRLARLSVVLG